MAKERTFTVEDTTDEMILEELKEIRKVMEDILHVMSRSQIAPSG